MKPEEWRDVPGYGGLYQASNQGRVRSWIGKWRPSIAQYTRRAEPVLLTPCWKKRARASYITLNAKRLDGKERQQVTVASVVYRAWLGDVPQGMVVRHKTINCQDNRPQNLTLCTFEKHMRLAGKRMSLSAPHGVMRRPVVKIDQGLQIIDAYPSQMAAARSTTPCVSPSAMHRYCTRLNKSVIAPDGFIYALDDEREIYKTMKRAMTELDAMGKRYADPFTGAYWDLPPDPDGPPDENIPFELAPALGGVFQKYKGANP